MLSFEESLSKKWSTKKSQKKFIKEVPKKAVANKRKLEEEKPYDAWNLKNRKWTKPASQIGYNALTVREIFTEMKDEVNKSSNFKSCVKFIGRCEKLLETGQFDIEGNDVVGKHFSNISIDPY